MLKKALALIFMLLSLLGCATPHNNVDKCLKDKNIFTAKYNQENDTLEYYIYMKLANYCYDFQMNNKIQMKDDSLILHADIIFYQGFCAQSIKTIRISKSLKNFKKEYDKVKYVRLYVHNIHTNKKYCFVSRIKQ